VPPPTKKKEKWKLESERRGRGEQGTGR